VPSSRLVLRPPLLADEDQFRRAHRAMGPEGFTFGLGYDEGAPFDEYVRLVGRRREGDELLPRWVPNTFLVADVGGVLVGRTSIRHELNDFLAREGGHIGYGVVPGQRRRGYATEILRQSLVIAHDLGIERALLTCDDDNVGSATVIERCGGVFERHVVGESGSKMRRYWIATAPAASG
jgi:predicted acetyltransferase